MACRRRPSLDVSAYALLLPLLGACGSGAEPIGAQQALTQTCFVAPACDADRPALGRPEGFRKQSSLNKSRLGSPNHRVHDLLLAPGDTQWIIGTFAYDGLGTSNLEGEWVDVYVLRGCGGAWELLGTATTTDDGEHATTEGVVDTGGHVYFQVPASQTLGLGRHRVLLVVRGDHTSAEGFVEVQPAGTPVFVSDVDGTLTTSELAELGAILTGSTPDAHPYAAATYQTLVALGYRPFYLTARTESSVNRTRTFVEKRGFPAGLVRTSQGNGLIGLSGASAANYKTDEIRRIQAHGFEVVLGVGNTDTDAQAYERTGLAERFMYGTNAGDALGAQRFDSYADLLGLAQLPARCDPPAGASR